MASFFGKIALKLFQEAQKTSLEFNRQVFSHLGGKVVYPTVDNDTYIKEGYQKNATVYSIINLIAKKATVVPFQVYRIKKESELKRYKSLTSGDMNIASMVKAQVAKNESLELINDSPLQDLLNRPNPSQSFASFLTEYIGFSCLTGNGYIMGVNALSGNKELKEMYILPSHNMEILGGTVTQPIRGYKTIFYNNNNIIEPENICHIKDFNPNYDGNGSHLYGQSPLMAGLRAMTANNEAMNTGVSQLQNQMSRGILSAKNGSLNQVQAQELKSKIRKDLSTKDVLVTGGELSWVNFGLSASDLSLIEQSNASQKDICNVYGVPIELMNNTDSTTYNNKNEAKKALYQNAIIPKLIQFRDEFNRWAVQKYGDDLYFDFDFSAVPELQEDYEKLSNIVDKAWYLTPNEKRIAMGYDVIEDETMNEILAPINLQSIKIDPFADQNDI